MNIIITGSSRGIGLELVKLFCNDNNNTVIGISRTKMANNTMNEIGLNSKFIPIEYDISNINNDFKEQLLSHFEAVDILINNAGYMVNKTFIDLTDADFDKIFTVNVKTVFKIIQQLLPNFSHKAHIVNISSMGGFQGSAKFKGLSLYSSSKGALNTLTECLAEELKDHNISINSLCLGAVNTEMLRAAFPGYEAPLHANEMAKFIKEFAESAHHYMNGKIIPVSISTP
jgi:NAD(P)-dependent dehydrogenase (short-subunit alcohol dehydrogenase family)